MSKRFERKILRLLIDSAQIYKSDLTWKYYTINAETLKKNLMKLSESCQSKVSEEEISHFADSLAKDTGFSILRTDPIEFQYKDFKHPFSRQMLAEAMGSIGSHLFPTRQRAFRCAYEAAREAIFLGYGDWENQFLKDPIDSVVKLFNIQNDETSSVESAVIFRDLRTPFKDDETVLQVLHKDIYFNREIRDVRAFLTFQEELRNDPFDSALVEKLSGFFNQRATIGARDALRRFLGSRHPWFDWQTARPLIESAFRIQHDANFNTPHLTYYLWNAEIPEEEIEATQESNRQVVTAFAEKLRQAVQKANPEMASLDYEGIALWTLDIHHDYPDFDIEVEGHLGARTHAEFLRHSIKNNVRNNLLGEPSDTRYNLNIRAHFVANHLFEKFFDSLDEKQIDSIFEAILSVLVQYDEINGIATDDGTVAYRRMPCDILVWQSLGQPDPSPDEALLDSFDLSQMTDLKHASYLRTYPDICEKLVVFYTLVLRHMIDTQHVPDLQPKNMLQDLMLLGLWGTRTENLHIHLYIDKDHENDSDLVSNITRSQLRFTGMQQLESFALCDALADLRQGTKLLRFLVYQLMPLIEPSILRVLGMFTMALEEFRTGTHAQETTVYAMLNYGIDLLRESSRKFIKGSVVNVSDVLELLIDKGLNHVQDGIKKTEENTEKITEMLLRFIH